MVLPSALQVSARVRNSWLRAHGLPTEYTRQAGACRLGIANAIYFN